jgi:glutathione peroxidase
MKNKVLLLTFLFYEKNSAKGLEILDFPCNQFGQQAPGTEEEILIDRNGNVVERFEPTEDIKVIGKAVEELL